MRRGSVRCDRLVAGSGLEAYESDSSLPRGAECEVWLTFAERCEDCCLLRLGWGADGRFVSSSDDEILSVSHPT